MAAGDVYAGGFKRTADGALYVTLDGGVANATSYGFAGTEYLFMPSANILQQRNGTTAQEQQWYGTTDSGIANYERFVIRTSAGSTLLVQEQAGTGSARGVTLGTSGNAVVTFRQNNTDRWVVTSTELRPTGSSNAYDVGAAAATCRSGYFGTGLNAPLLNVTSGGTSSGAVTSLGSITKAVASIAESTPTAVFTVTIPNAAHSASIKVRLVGSLGAGGAIGANESTQSAEYNIDIARTAGVNAVATISTVVGQPAAAAVAGAATAATVGTLGAISGAVGVANTFTVLVTITKSGGASTNHTCVATAAILNANATGITIA